MGETMTLAKAWISDEQDLLHRQGVYFSYTRRHRTCQQDHTAYIMEYGTDSWELDAMEPVVLADLVSDAVGRLRNQDLWESALARQEEGRERLQAVADSWEEDD